MRKFRLIIITGLPGTGKSLLIHQLVQLAQLGGVLPRNYQIFNGTQVARSIVIVEIGRRVPAVGCLRGVVRRRVEREFVHDRRDLRQKSPVPLEGLADLCRQKGALFVVDLPAI